MNRDGWCIKKCWARAWTVERDGQLLEVDMDSAAAAATVHRPGLRPGSDE